MLPKLLFVDVALSTDVEKAIKKNPRLQTGDNEGGMRRLIGWRTWMISMTIVMPIAVMMVMPTMMPSSMLMHRHHMMRNLVEFFTLFNTETRLEFAGGVCECCKPFRMFCGHIGVEPSDGRRIGGGVWMRCWCWSCH